MARTNSPYYKTYTIPSPKLVQPTAGQTPAGVPLLGQPTSTPPRATVRPPAINATLSRGIVEPGGARPAYTQAYTAKQGTGRP